MTTIPVDLAQATGKEFPALIASMPIDAQERRIAFGVIIFLSVMFLLVMPFAHIQVGRIDAFIPVIQTVLCFADLITAVFLFAQYSIQPQRALLALAGGFIFAGLFAFLQTLDFPGAYSATGLLSGGPSGAAWLFSFWHISFPLAVIAYVLLKGRDETAANLPVTFEPGRNIAVTVACILVVTAGLTWVAAAGYLPSTFGDLRRVTPFYRYLTVAMWMLNAVALVFMFVRMRTILGLWLAVVLFASLPDLTLPLLYPVIRYSLGWYAGRIFTLIASCTILIVLLVESTRLYARLASAILLQRRERANRLMSVDAATAAIAHEIAQPLTGISTHCSAALNWLKKTPPDLEKVSANLTATINGSHRAAEVIASTRAMFKPTARLRTMIDLNGVARQVLEMLEHDFHEHGVSVSTDFQEGLSRVMADRTQLQQAIMNLIKNAIDAMNAGATHTKYVRLITSQGGNSVVSLSVRDSGPGIDPGDEARIFDPFFTTKPSGVGLGLSICRKIVEGHGGELRLAKTGSIGCAFEISLPIVATTDG